MSLRDNVSLYQTGVYAVTRTPRQPLVNGQRVPVPPIDMDVATVVPFDSMFPATTNLLNIPAHGLLTGAGPVWLTTTLAPFPTGLPIDGLTPSWVIVVDVDDVRLASTKANALADTALVIADAGAGDLHVSSTFQLPASVRPLDGEELEDLAEGQREEYIRKVYALHELVGENETYEADVIVLDDGKRYRVTKLTYYVRNNFWRAVAEKLDIQ